jgi:hypothetical protein
MYKRQIRAGLFWLVGVFIEYIAFVFPGMILHMACVYNAYSRDPNKVNEPKLAAASQPARAPYDPQRSVNFSVSLKRGNQSCWFPPRPHSENRQRGFTPPGKDLSGNSNTHTAAPAAGGFWISGTNAEKLPACPPPLPTTIATYCFPFTM